MKAQPTIRTLADCRQLFDANGTRIERPCCPSCGHPFAPNARVELFQSANLWVLVGCPECGRRQPFRIEQRASA